MNFNAETYETIENYLTGNLQGTPHSNFEKRLESEKLLAEEVMIHERLYKHIELTTVLESDEGHAFQGKLNNALEQHNHKNSGNDKIHRLNWKPLAIAASITLLIGFFLFSNYNTATTPLTLYDNYAKHETLALASKGTETYNFSAITTAYQQENYKLTDEKIRMALQELPQNHPHWFSLKLTQGICQLELPGKIDDAKTIFQGLSKADHPDAPKADWYLVLTYLKQGNVKLATEVIDATLAKGHGYKAREMREINKVVRDW